MNQIQKIMFGELRPWLDNSSESDDFYKPLTRNLNSVQTMFNPHYKLNFIRHFSNKTQYYKKLIDNDLTIYCNNTFNEADNVSNNVIAYIIDKSRKQLHSKIKETAEIINNQSFSLSYITSQNVDFSLDKPFKEATYIMFYLLSSLIKCWLEIQHHFENHIIEDDLWEVADFYTQLLQINVPDETNIKEIQTIELETQKEMHPFNKENTKNEKNRISFTYVNIDKNPEAISDLFNSLKDVAELIDKQTRLVDFKKIFSGKSITRPVIWIGSPTELYYFIKYIHNVRKVVEDTNKQQWNITCNCFLKADGSSFDRAKLKALKTPAQESKSKIERAANNLTL